MTHDEQQLLRDKYDGIESKEFAIDCERLAANEPLAYIIGWQPFLGLKIYLDSHPLIPRPETEWWTEQLLLTLRQAEGLASSESHSAPAREEAIFQQKNMPLAASKSSEKPFQFLDLCAGSGAIGCAALAALPNAQVFFGEIDPTHEATIIKNVSENKLDEQRARVLMGDLFEQFVDTKFDLIAINPPYIPAGRELDQSVVDHEPHNALFSGNDGLDLIRRIASELQTYLAPNGQAWIECDTSNIDEALTLFTAQGLHASIKNDQYNVPRVIVVTN